MIRNMFFSVVFSFCALSAVSQENQTFSIANDSLLNAELIKKYRFLSDSLKPKIPSFQPSADSLPVIVPKHLHGVLIVVKPDSSVHYHIRNFRSERKNKAVKIPAK